MYFSFLLTMDVCENCGVIVLNGNDSFCSKRCFYSWRTALAKQFGITKRCLHGNCKSPVWFDVKDCKPSKVYDYCSVKHKLEANFEKKRLVKKRNQKVINKLCNESSTIAALALEA